MKRLSMFLNTPAKLVFAMVLIVMGTELLIMLLHAELKEEVFIGIWHLVDPVMLSMSLAPTFYILFFKPMRDQQAELERQVLELRRNEQLTALIDALPDAVFLKDGEGRWLIVNEPARQMFQLHNLPWQGKTEMELADMHTAFRAVHEGCLASDEAAWQAGKLHVSEEIVAGEDGRCAIVEARKMPIFDNDGRRKGLVIIGRDVTQSKAVSKQISLMVFALDRVKEGIFMVGEDARICYANQETCRSLGYSSDELLGLSIGSVEPDVPMERWADHWRDLKANGSFLLESRHKTKDGRFFPVELSLNFVEFDGIGYNMMFVRDITERKLAESLLRESDMKLRALYERSPVGIVLTDMNGRYLEFNEAFRAICGYSTDELKALGNWDLTPSEYQPQEVAQLESLHRTGQYGPYEKEYIQTGGKRIPIRLNGTLVNGKDGQSYIWSVVEDIAERKRIENALVLRKQELRTLIENSPDFIARFDRDCCLLYVNSAYCAMVKGCAATRHKGQSKKVDCSGDRKNCAIALQDKILSVNSLGQYTVIHETKINDVFANGKSVEFELKWSDKDGKEVCSHIRLAAECDMSGNISSVLAVGRDITELSTFRQKIHQMAFYDSLTSLPNRALFNDRLRQMLMDASWHGQLAGVMMLDLDRFKVVNDTLGHPAGDELLREVAARLTYCVRGYDTVARLGGDEFAILLPDVRAGDDLGRIASKILESFAEPFLLEGKEVFVSCSIGIALFPDDALDADGLFKYADSAMYFAKRTGRNNFRFYSKELTVSACERLTLESDLRSGFCRGELELFYQPKVNLADGFLVGSEALLRWNHPQRGMVPPDKFIAIAEDCGLIVEIGEWVLRNACSVACEWNCPDNPLHKVAINLSARQFQQGNLLNTVRSVLDETGCSPEWIELEITESLLLDEDGEVLEMLTAFREMGITIAIDDFGTGYSSLSYLARFPIDTLKIDRSFVSRLTESGHHSELVRAIISIAKSLGQRVVAEGVETAEQAALLQTYGCQLAQGYLYGKPMPRQIFEDFATATALS